MDEEQEFEETLNTEEEETSTNDEEEKDYKQLYENQKIRAEKAEKKLKDEPKVEKTPKEETETPKKEVTLSVKDSARLQAAQVPVDDWDEVVEYAEFKEISVAEALNNNVVKSTLAGKAEERRVAEATSTGGGKRGSAKVSGTSLLNKAKDKGEIPESDGDIDKMLDAKYES